MQLFDRTLAVETGPFPFGVAPIELLSRSASPICEATRLRLERMLDMYPVDARASMVSRLRIPEQASDAFFELFVLELFIDRGYTLTGVELPLAHTTYVVDFSFTGPDGVAFLVEVVCCNPPRTTIGPRKMLDEVFNAIDAVDCLPFQVEVVDVQGAPTQSVRRRVMHTWVSSWLETLVDEPDADRTKEFALSDSCVVTLRAVPRDTGALSGLLREPPCVRASYDVVTSVLRRLFEKAYKYGPLDVPLVIALNVAGSMGGTREMFDEAVHGELDPSIAVPEVMEHPGEYVPAVGALHEPGGPLTRVSAVLGFIGVNPLQAKREQGVVYLGRNAAPVGLSQLGLATCISARASTSHAPLHQAAS